MSRARVKAFILEPELIVDLLSGRTRAVPGTIPEDAKLERYGHHWQTHSAIIVLSHASFPEIDVDEELVLERIEYEYSDEKGTM